MSEILEEIIDNMFKCNWKLVRKGFKEYFLIDPDGVKHIPGEVLDDDTIYTDLQETYPIFRSPEASKYGILAEKIFGTISSNPHLLHTHKDRITYLD
jgi:hypothetical protein